MTQGASNTPVPVPAPEASVSAAPPDYLARLEAEKTTLTGVRAQLAEQLLGVDNQLMVIGRILNPQPRPESEPRPQSEPPPEADPEPIPDPTPPVGKL